MGGCGKFVLENSNLSLVIPIFNESENLPELISRLKMVFSRERSEYEIVFVDDGSTDRSREIISRASVEDSHFRAVFLKKNGGQQAALLAGFKAATGTLCITLDADLQNPPEEIPKILCALLSGHDVVGSVRKKRQDTIFRRVCSRIANKSVQCVIPKAFPMHDYGCMLRGYSKNVLDCLRKIESTRGNARTYLPILAMAFAENPAEIEVAHEKRSRGASKYAGFALVDALWAMLVSAWRVRSLLRETPKSLFVCADDFRLGRK